VTWHSIVVVGDVGHKRVAVVASSSVTWHARGCWGCVVVSGGGADVAHETAVAGSNGDVARRGAVDTR
jgi:hypothetical protein